MTRPEKLVYRPAPGEQHGALTLLVFVLTPALLTAPWWLAFAMLIGAWILTR